MDVTYLPITGGILNSRSNRTPATKALSVIFSVAGTFLFSVIVYSLLTSFPSLADTARALGDPWSITVIIDSSVGFVFSATYLVLRDGPPVLGVPPLALALAVPFIGNDVLYLYAGFVLLARHPTLADALLVAPSLGDMLPSRAARRGRNLWMVLFATMGVILAAACAYAGVIQSLADGWVAIRSQRWLLLTFADTLCGLAFVAVFVVVREGSLFTPVSIAMVVALALTGNVATCVYVVVIARQAAAHDVAFRDMLLSKRGSLFS